MRIYQIPIYVEVEVENHIVFPERMNWANIEQIRKEQGAYIFSCQNLLQPVAKENQKFQIEWLLYWRDVNVLPPLRIVLCVDPANTAKKKSDYTAISVHGWDENQNWYVLDLFRDKLEHENDRANKVFELHRKWSRHSQTMIPVLYETIGFQVSDKHNIERMQRDRGYHFPIIEMKGGAMHSKSKADRITGLQVYFERNQYNDMAKIYIPERCTHYSQWKKRSIDMVEEFRYEYIFFTPELTLEHDDLIDTVTFPLYWDGFKNVKASPLLKKEEPRSGMTAEDLCSIFEDVGHARSFRGNDHFSEEELWEVMMSRKF